MISRVVREGVVSFVMARWNSSGGFGAAPSLPPSIEDSYYALQVLNVISPFSGVQDLEWKRSPLLKDFLLRLEDKETWTVRTVFHFLPICRLCEMDLEKGCRYPGLGRLSERANALEDVCYLARISREIKALSGESGFSDLKYDDCRAWRTAEELWMCLYLNRGETEEFHGKGRGTIEWLQACQNRDGGFGFLLGTMSFMENSWWCLRGLAMLGDGPLSYDSARDFILRARTAAGGFARKCGAVAYLSSTWHALASLELLRSLEKGTSVGGHLTGGC